ncbi:MAG: hypothetical protein JWN43_2032 [Gammaproteobacteria bacterium]|nr:hypothetical protein [Gammaproteobacteria bacterium]
MTKRLTSGPNRSIASICAGIAAMAACCIPFGTASTYEIVSVPNGGTIDGYAKLSGTAPSKAPLKVTKDQKLCGSSIADPSYSVGDEGGVKNVIVYLKNITKGKAPTEEELAFVSDHCMFQPRAQAAMVGERVTASSNDPVLHDFHPQKTDNNATIYNVALPFPGVSITKPLPANPGLIKIKDDAHEWMHAWIMQLDNPYYATTGDDGHFTIKDVPPGNYTLVAWHEAAGEQAAPVTVAAGQTATPTIAIVPKQGITGKTASRDAK